MSISAEDVIEAFKSYCDEYNRLFIPDNPRQDAIAESLSKHYGADDLLMAMKYFVQNDQGPFLLFEFALKSRNIIEKSSFDRKSEQHFKNVVAETRKKIENEL